MTMIDINRRLLQETAKDWFLELHRMDSQVLLWWELCKQAMVESFAAEEETLGFNFRFLQLLMGPAPSFVHFKTRVSLGVCDW